MVSFTGLCLAATVALSAVAAPTASSDEMPSKVKRNTPNETGTSGGFYYQFCTQQRSGDRPSELTTNARERWHSDCQLPKWRWRQLPGYLEQSRR